MILTDELRRENENVRKILRILQRICEKIDSDDQVPERDLDEIVQLAETLAQRSHQRKEEETLLSTMEDSPVHEQGALAALLEDHHAIRRHFEEMKASLSRYRAGDTNALLTFAASSRFYVELLNEHLQVAQKDLYPRIDMHLSRKKQDELMNRFASYGVDADRAEQVLRLSRAYLD